VTIQHPEILHLLFVRGILRHDSVLRLHPIAARGLVPQSRTWTGDVLLGDVMTHVALGQGLARVIDAQGC